MENKKGKEKSESASDHLGKRHLPQICKKERPKKKDTKGKGGGTALTLGKNTKGGTVGSGGKRRFGMRGKNSAAHSKNYLNKKGRGD